MNQMVVPPHPGMQVTMPLLGCVMRICLAGGGGLGFPQDAGALSWGSEGGRPCGSGPRAHAGSACSSCQPHPGPEGMYQRLGRVVSECEDGVRLRGRAALPADRLEQADCGECPQCLELPPSMRRALLPPPVCSSRWPWGGRACLWRRAGVPTGRLEGLVPRALGVSRHG